ncbi:hypothetical protein AC1031_011587 [Aphanomyces cochlioides]|nr:hypothetical protein AC1031_011587 [Aphanomyces cochlioides]
MAAQVVPGILRRISNYQPGIYEDVMVFRKVHDILHQTKAIEVELSTWLARYPCISRLLCCYESLKYILVYHGVYTGRVDMLQYLHEHYGLQELSSDLVQIAVRGQRLESLRYLRQIGYKLPARFDPIYLAWSHDAVFEFTLEHYSPLCTTRETMEYLARFGNLRGLELMFPKLNRAQGSLAWSIAASFGYLEFAQSLYARWIETQEQVVQFIDNIEYRRISADFTNATSRGLVDAAMWLYDAWNPIFDQRQRNLLATHCLKYVVAILMRLQHATVWQTIAMHSETIPIFASAWVPTIEDPNARRRAQVTMLHYAVYHHDGDRLEAKEWLGDGDEIHTCRLVFEYSIDERIASDVFHCPLGAAAMQRAIENDHIATIRLLLRCGVQFMSEDIFHRGGVRAIKFYMDEIDPGFEISADILIDMTSKLTKDGVFQFVHKIWKKSQPPDIVEMVESQCMTTAAAHGQLHIVIYLAKSFQHTHSPSEYESFLIQHVLDFYRALSQVKHGANDLFGIWNPVLESCFEVEFVIESLEPILALNEDNLKRLVNLPIVHIPVELVVECALVKPHRVSTWRAFCILLDAKMKTQVTRAEIQRACFRQSMMRTDYEAMQRLMEMEFDFTIDIHCICECPRESQVFLIQLMDTPGVHIDNDGVAWTEELQSEEFQCLLK